MELDIREGKRVLYKHDNQWRVGALIEVNNTKLTEKGLYLSIIPYEFLGKDQANVLYFHDAEINDIFLDAQPVEEYWKQYSDLFMTKEEYMNFIEQEDFVRAAEYAYVSDGEYYYYPVSKFTRNWLEKQPFNYIVRSN